MGGRRSAKRVNPFVAPLCAPRTHAPVDRAMSQYWLVRTARLCRYGQASHSLRLSQSLQRLVRPRIDYPLCGAAEYPLR